MLEGKRRGEERREVRGKGVEGRERERERGRVQKQQYILVFAIMHQPGLFGPKRAHIKIPCTGRHPPSPIVGKNDRTAPIRVNITGWRWAVLVWRVAETERMMGIIPTGLGSLGGFFLNLSGS